MMRGKRENFFSREKPNVGFGILSLSPRAPLSLSRKARNFFKIMFCLPMQGTKLNNKKECGYERNYFIG